MALTLQQTKAEEDLLIRLKDYAKDNKKLLMEVQADAIKDVVSDLVLNKNVDFLAIPKDGITVSFKIPEELVLKVKGVLNNKVSARGFYYTAFVLYDRKIQRSLAL